MHGPNLETNNGTHSNATHGAGVMGILGASGNNGMGISGLNWNVKIMPVSRAVANVSALIEGYEYIKEFRKKFNQSHGQDGDGWDWSPDCLRACSLVSRNNCAARISSRMTSGHLASAGRLHRSCPWRFGMHRPSSRSLPMMRGRRGHERNATYAR